MLHKFEVGGVYQLYCCLRPIAIKVVRISADREFVSRIWQGSDGKEERCKIVISESISSETTVSGWSRHIRAIEFHRLHPFFPTGVYQRNIKINPDGIGQYKKAVNRFHKEIMKTFVLFFFSVKLTVIARRVKERMYAPGGIGFIASQESFYRAAKSQRIG